MSKKKKRKGKIKLPKDRNGIPYNIGDWVMFDDGPIRLASLTVCDCSVGGKDGAWFGGTEEDDYATDNLANGTIITRWDK
jgi:hypothetical protein